ncbi:hypothetical protein AB669_20700 [Pedobacter sp. BMA]|nr:hypothetical protein AB669_20700 [Pedobacter sp. BMA]
MILKSLCVTLTCLAVLEVKGQSKSNEFNRLPLKQDVYVQLPIGSIKAKGWLLKQLEQQRDGATGFAEALYPEDDNLGKNTDWLGGTGNGWERVPYYVKGLVALAYTLDDAGLKAKAQKYIDWTLNSQQENGLFGPGKMKDWWPRMPMMYALQSYYEATLDKRVIPFLTRYFDYELANLDADPLKEWGKSRAGDNMEIAIWLYNKTGDSKLLRLVEKLNQQAYPWVDIYSNNEFYFFGDDFQPKHMVNVAQALKYPVIYAQLNETKANMDAFSKGIEHIMNDHGQPQGLGSGTEFLAGRNSTGGVETCTVVEWMQSLETAVRIIHDSSIGDQLEKIAFNALPAQFSRDFKNHSYYTLPNQVMSAYGELGFNQDYGSGIVLSPYSGYGCCRYNMHMGWPYFVKNAVVATPDKGLAIVTYGPMEIERFVANDKIKITEETDYPFDEQIRLKLSLNGTVAFPLILRIPAWCNLPVVKLNGVVLKGVKPGEFLKINRQWKDADQLELNFPMHIVTPNQVNNSVSIERGPLVYALEIKAEKSITKTHAVAGFTDYEIYPKSAWNYGLAFDKNNVAGSIKVEKGLIPINPFIAETSPIKLKVKAKKIPSWGLAPNKLTAFDVPVSPVFSKEKTEEVTLVPYGSENIRLSLFPTIGQPKKITGNLIENFEKGMPDNWVFYGGGWFFKGGTIQAASNAGSGGYGMNGSKYIANNTNFKDFSYVADIKVKTDGDAGLIFRVSNPAIGADAYQGYYVGLSANNSQIQIGKAVSQKWIPLATVKYPVKLNSTYRLKVVAKGTKIEVFVDGASRAIVSVIDGEYQSGSIGFRTYKALASFDSLEINTL